jgi:hypothetical protein
VRDGPLALLQPPHLGRCFATKCVMAPFAVDALPLAFGGCFVTILLVALTRADTLPSLSRFYLVDALPPQLHLLCWHPLCGYILSCKANLVRFVMEGSPYRRLSFLFRCNF